MIRFSQTQQFGNVGEAWVQEQLSDRGYDFEVPADYQSRSCDVIVEGLCVEVKIARKTLRRIYRKDGSYRLHTRWQWHIKNTIPEDRETLFILIAVDREGYKYPFIVPGSVINEHRHISITSHPSEYCGWLAQYLNRWDMVEYLINGVYQNGGPLFHELERVA